MSGDLGAEKDFKRLVLPQRSQRRDLKDYLITHHFQLWLGQAPQTLVLAIGGDCCLSKFLILRFSLCSVVSGDLGAEKDFKRLVLPQRSQRTQRRDLKDYLITHHFQLWLGQAPQTLVLAIGIAENALVR